MLIRKNTKAFKTILEIVTACRDRPDRESLIRVYITKAGDTVKDRISVEGIQGGSALFYEMNYQAVLGNLKSSTHQLQQSDEIPGLYFFHSSSNKVWDETPFEFDEAIKKEFASLPDLPTVRKKEKSEKVILPTPKKKTEAKAPSKKEKATDVKPKKSQKEKDKNKKDEIVETKKSAKIVALWPKQPDYHLRNEIHFTGLERIVFRQPQLTKKGVLDYYDKISEYLLPYLKDRPQLVYQHREGRPGTPSVDLDTLKKNTNEEIPDWINPATAGKGKSQEQLLLCNDREHLLLYVQIGSVEFHPCHSRIKTLEFPDYMVLVIESPDYDLGKAIDVALASKDIITGLQLPSFVKTDGASGLHIYFPLDMKSSFEVAKRFAEYLCKLIRLKIPDRVSIKGRDQHAHAKVTLDYSMNEQGKGAIAPYSLVAQSANVATPFTWEEVARGQVVECNYETIFKRLKEEGDPFATLFKKKVNAEQLVERIEENYSFLF